jgi:hypothetical protein
MRLKIGLLFISFLFLQNILVAQDFIKYIFEKNKIKIVVPVEMKEVPDNLIKQEFEGLNLCKEWKTEKGLPYLQAFILTDSSESEFSLSEFFNKVNSSADQFTSTKNGIRKINNQKIVSFEELNSGDKFVCLFTTKLDDNRQLLFYYSCSSKQIKKNSPILSEIIRTLTVN